MKKEVKREHCPDCQVEIGSLHQDGCDVERCPACGSQRLMCQGMGECSGEGERIPWNGFWPGIAECEEYGFYCYDDPDGYGDPARNYGHTECGPDHPRAIHDLNRLCAECKWSPEKAKWVRK